MNRFFQIDGTNLTLFDVYQGHTLETGRWKIDNDPTGFNTIHSDTIHPSIDVDGLIKLDRAAGKESQIAYVGVDGRTGLYLWLEGVITAEHFEHAIENEEDGYIELRHVYFAGQARVVRILQNPEYAIGTYDTNDKVIE